LTEMENERGDLVVIFAGYPDRMATFFSSNPGLSSRVPHHIAFDDYSHGELLEIAELMVASENFRLDQEPHVASSESRARGLARPRLAKSRSVRTAIERARRRQARRLVALQRPLRKDGLLALTAEDIYGSSVFDEVR